MNPPAVAAVDKRGPWSPVFFALASILSVTVFITKAAKPATLEAGLPVEKPVASAAAAADSSP